MKNYQLLCTSRATLKSATEYHITFQSNGKKYRSNVLYSSKNTEEVTFSEVEEVSLDHYRLDEFEKLFITNYQRLSEVDIKSDTNFRLVLQYILNNNATLNAASLIGAAMKPLSLGYLYHVYFRLDSGDIVKV